MRAVVHRLAHQRVVRDLDRSRHVLLAGDLSREHRGQQVVRAHPLNRRRRLLATTHSQHRQRPRHVPAPARAEHRYCQQRLLERLLYRFAPHQREHVVQRKAVLRAKREEDRVVARGRLQLEVERLAEVLPQRQPERAVDPPAERRVHDELHPAAVVEEALEDDVLTRRHDTDRVLLRAHVADDLLGCLLGQPGLVSQPRDRVFLILELSCDGPPQLRHLIRKLGRARRRLAKPERDRRRQPVRVVHAHDARLDAPDAPRGCAEQEDVARHAFDGEVFVQRADEHAVRLGQHPVVRNVRDCAAALYRGHASRPAATGHAVDAVAMEEVRRAPRPHRDAIAEHVQHVVEIFALERRVRRRPPHEIEQFVFVPWLTRALRHDLLCQDVEWRDRRGELIKPARADTVDQRRALDQLVACRREEPPFWRLSQRVARTTDALEERRHAARRLQLAHEVHRSDIDTQLQRRRRHQRFHLARLEPSFERQPPVLRQAAVVRADVLLAQPLREVVRGSFRQPACVHEHEGCPVLADQLRQPVVDVAPLLAGADRLQVCRRHVDCHIQVALVSGVNDGAVALLRVPLREARHLALFRDVFACGDVDRLSSGSHQELRRQLDRPHRRRQPDAGRPLPAGVVEPGQRQRQVATALIADQRVDLIHDHRLRAPDHLAASFRRQHQVERLRRRDQNVWRPPHDLAPLRLRRVARAQRCPDRR